MYKFNLWSFKFKKSSQNHMKIMNYCKNNTWSSSSKVCSSGVVCSKQSPEGPWLLSCLSWAMVWSGLHPLAHGCIRQFPLQHSWGARSAHQQHDVALHTKVPITDNIWHELLIIYNNIYINNPGWCLIANIYELKCLVVPVVKDTWHLHEHNNVWMKSFTHFTVILFDQFANKY